MRGWAHPGGTTAPHALFSLALSQDVAPASASEASLEEAGGPACAKCHPRADSEWAALAALEAAKLAAETAARKAAIAATKAGEKALLDAQHCASAAAKAAAAAEKAAEGRRLDADAQTHKCALQRKEEERRAHHEAIRMDREAQLAAAERARHLAAVAKHEQEAELLAHMNAQLAKDKELLAARKAEHREHMQATIKTNEAKIEAKKAALVADKEEDARIAVEYTRMQEAQEARRANALRELFERTHTRAQAAGQSAVAVAKAKETEELQRIAANQAQRDLQLEAAAAAKKLAAAAAQADVLASLAQQMALKERAEEALKAEMAAHARATVQADAAAAASAQAASAERKRRDLELQTFLEKQVADKAAAVKLGHLMSPQERALNAQRLAEAASLRGSNAV